MKRILPLLVFFLIAIPIFAQDEIKGTSIHGPFRDDGFMGLVLKRISIHNTSNLLAGLRKDWVVSSKFAIGGVGYGLTKKFEGRDLELAYGGFELEYVIATRKRFYLSVQTLMGIGRLAYLTKDKERSGDPDLFFIAEPQLNFMLNATKSFHLGFGISDRFVRGVEFSGIDNSDLRGLSDTFGNLPPSWSRPSQLGINSADN